MVSGLLDTAILVDLLRDHPPAKRWIAQQQSVGITLFVWLEILEGVRNQQEQSRIVRFLNGFERVRIEYSDLEWATRHLTMYRLSHSVDAFDCLIAAVSHRLQIPLFTPNLKHFTTLIDRLAQKPY